MTASHDWRAAWVRLRALGGTLVLLGVGSEWNGDDVAGLLVVRKVQGSRSVIPIEGGSAPENYAGRVSTLRPAAVVFVDAALVGASPGTIGWFTPEDLQGTTAFTHGLPLTLLAAYLTQEAKCPIALLGIQPGDTAFGAPISPAVSHAVDQIALFLNTSR